MNPSRRDYRSVSAFAASAVALIGAFTLLGWGLNIRFLKSIYPAFPNMAPNLAAAFVFLGVSLSLLRDPRVGGAWRWGARVCYFLVFLIGALTFLEYLLGWDAHIDELLLNTLTFEPGERFSGRPAFNACVGLIMSAIALVGLDSGSDRLIRLLSQIIALMIGFLSLVVVIGYLTELVIFFSHPLSRTSHGGDMAFHAAFAFAFFCVGLLAARPDFGVMRGITGKSVGGIAVRQMLAAALFGPAVLALFAAIGGRMGVFEVLGSVSIITVISIVVFGVWAFWTIDVLDRFEVERGRQDEERDRILAREQKARKEAENAVRLRDEMVAVISHELKNPLMALGSGIALIQKLLDQDPKLEKVLGLVERLKPSVHRMNRLISDLLDATRLEAQMLRLEPRVCDLFEIVQEVIKSHEPYAQEKGVKLQGEVQPDCRRAFCDSERTFQIFTNLLNNAIKFTDAGGSVRILAKKINDEIEIRVIDTGKGISKENLAHVFDRFWQAKDTAYQGTGLGLSIVKGLVETQGGRVWIESELGIGTTVFFTMPISETQGKRSDKAA